MNRDITERLDRIENNLSEIMKQLDHIKKSGKHMDSHIDFVNSVYSTVRYPLNSIMSRFGKKSLPMITPSLDIDKENTESTSE